MINSDGLQSKGDLYLPQQIHWDEVWMSAAPAISNDLEKVENIDINFYRSANFNAFGDVSSFPDKSL